MTNSSFDLSGKVAIVTGGNGGIGLGIAEGLAGAGANVSIVGRDRAKTDAAAERLRGYGVEALALVADVSDDAAVRQVVASTADRLGGVDILVNNAGIAIRGMLQDYTEDDWDSVVDVNLKGMFLFSRAVYPHMVKAGGGKVINIGSMTSILGRLATYSGQEISMEAALASEVDTMPKRLAWDAEPPTLPNEDGFYPIAIPGETNVL